MEYQHGGDIYSYPVTMDYSANINPLGLPKGVKEELLGCLEEEVCSLYPDSACRSLRRELSRFHQVPEDWITCGNGAADLIFALVRALRPRRGLVLAPSFLEYAQALKSEGSRAEAYFLKKEKGFALDIKDLCGYLEKAEKRGNGFDILFLCNPNNPTGIPVKKEGVLELAETCRKFHIFLAVDECFCDFLKEPEEFSVIPKLGELEHVFVLRAFTKMYAMAGLRLGYGISCSPELNQGLQSVRQPWSVSGLAQRAGIAALKEGDYVKRTRDMLLKEGPRFSEALKELGLEVFPSQANYLFFRLPSEDGENREDQQIFKEELTSHKTLPPPRGWLWEALLKRRILIRSCSNYPGLDASYYRVCIKTRQENEAFTEQLAEVLREHRKSYER